MFIRSALFAALLGICVLWAGCDDGATGGSSNRGGGTSSPSRRPESSGGAVPPRTAGQSLFRLPASDGNAVTVQAPAALFFYTSWCGYCKRVLPEVNRLTGVARSKGWRVYGVQVAEGPAQVNGFIQQYNPSFPVLMDQQSIVANQYGVKGYPTFVLIDANGRVVYNAHEPPRGF